ncbi:hypothetical protein J421_4658 (plasmid) [Gemmatirosa kalamazoonensis]|uniref:Uncharacterized protein n=1 Tax=Gemmatirosa kalamazoonensis TaxID=861299 RepID=W0RRK5_9BACT|nr:hypothetical protein [Gemmatirosa kalamazoonensis]AHG92125.1 hypothetical protein J421_4590 [Gemmatirosa kalamazoonensis]AHG92193.1 hypothetical protein J421_4658 [Gemmatirosa kalamazoonensis]
MSTKQSSTKPAMWKRYAIDPKAATDGAWVSFDAGVEMCVRAQSSRAVREVVQAINTRNRPAILKAASGVLPIETQDADQLEVLSAVVSNWRGVVDLEGNTLPCTPENVRAVLGHPALVELKNDVWAASVNAETFRAAALELLSGNSASTSAGTSAEEASASSAAAVSPI